LSRKVGKELPLYAAQLPRRTQISSISGRILKLFWNFVRLEINYFVVNSTFYTNVRIRTWADPLVKVEENTVVHKLIKL